MEFNVYENAVANYFSKLSISKMPLVSWDFYGNFYKKTKNSIGDASLLNQIVEQNKWSTNWAFQDKLQDDTVIVVTDANLKIVFASKNIVDMNGYVPNEVIGNSPKMFQGELTCDIISKEISEAVNAKLPFDKIIMNYCKDGSLYKCHIKGYPIFDHSGNLTNFIAFEKIAA
ncbi:MAG: PAS domain-containing protein [Flavobacterium sp.]|nr:PAS domain-containing protein [Flavobacterium sp.]